MYILLVEPDIVLAKTYTTTLKKHGHVVSTAHTGQQAIEAADTMPQVNCIIMEMQLPGFNGVAFLQELRSYSDFMQTPVIINSYMQPPHADDMATLTTNFAIKAWLYKPTTSLAQLVKTIERWA
jgi:CheY-like chemotaxis protein